VRPTSSEPSDVKGTCETSPQRPWNQSKVAACDKRVINVRLPDDKLTAQPKSDVGKGLTYKQNKTARMTGYANPLP
jgi:hypothetical protein